MPTTTIYLYPDISYGWLPEFLEKGYTFSLRPGQWMAQVPFMADQSAAFYNNKGIMMMQNVGQVDTSVPFSGRAVLDSGAFLLDAMGTPNVNSWSQSAMNTHIDARIDSGLGMAFYVDQFGEWLGNHGGPSVDQWNPKPQQQYWAQRLTSKLEPLGGRFYGGYDGHMDLAARFSAGNTSAVRTALGSPSAALSFAPSGSPFGNDFYSAGAYAWRHGNIKIYHVGDSTTTPRWLAAKLAGLEIDLLARQALGTSRRVAAIAFCGYSETLGAENFSVKYRSYVPDTQGYWERSTFPMWSHNMQFFLYFYCLVKDFDLFCWESEERYGRNPNIIPANGFGGGTYVGSGSPTRASVVYTTTGAATAYPPNPKGCNDLALTAANMYAWCHQGTHYNGAWASHSSNGGAFTSVASTYVLDRYEAGQGYALVGGSGSYRWVVYCNPHQAAGTSETVTVNYGGGTITFDAFGGVTYPFRVAL